jgi:hypothetical protein
MVKKFAFLALVAVGVGVVAKVISSRNGVTGNDSGLFPGIGGDTWPPVPVAPGWRQGLLAKALTAEDHRRSVRGLNDPDLATTSLASCRTKPAC